MSNDDKRSHFLAKVFVVGLLSAAGLGCLYGGLSALQEERGVTAVVLLVLGVVLGGAFLRTAWKVAGE